jgi:Flp pilus assembly pilin Flp
LPEVTVSGNHLPLLLGAAPGERMAMSRFTFGFERLLVVGLISARAPRFTREEGQTFVEYAVILGVVCVALAGALTFLHDTIGGFYTGLTSQFDAAVH